MKAPRILIALCRRFEGCRLIAYLCPARVWTCGWGATGADVNKDTRWTQDQADQRLEQDALVYYIAAGRISPVLWLVGDAKHAAIGDFNFNLGSTRYKASTLRRRIDAQDWQGAAEELEKWVYGGGKKLPGLVLRRQEEARLILQE